MAIPSVTGPTNFAARHFGQDTQQGGPITAAPRLGYNFSVEFLLNQEIAISDASFGHTFTFNRVSGVSVPDVQYDTQPVNQYNRIRHVATRQVFGPASLSIYDTKDNRFTNILKAYSKHYFNGMELDEDTFSGYSMNDVDFQNGKEHPFGAQSISPTARFFIEELRIHNIDFNKTEGRTHQLFNCMITSVSLDRFDYSSSLPILYQIQVQPEHVNVGPLNLTNVDGGSDVDNPTQDLAVTVSNRPANVVNAVPVNNPNNLQPFTGTLKAGEKIRNIDGKSFVVPAS